MLTPKREAFAGGLAEGMSQAAAYRVAFPASLKWLEKSVWERASVLAADIKVQSRVAELRAAAIDANAVTVGRIVREMARIGFFDIRKLVDESGAPIPLRELDDSTAAAVAGLEVCRVGNADVGLGEVLKFRLADKNKALENLMRHLGGFAADNGQSKTVIKVTGVVLLDDE